MYGLNIDVVTTRRESNGESTEQGTTGVYGAGRYDV